MPVTIRAIVANCAGLTTSSNKIMSMMAVPTTPTPTQIASALLVGSDFMAIPSKPKLSEITITVPTLGHSREKTFGVFKANGPANFKQSCRYQHYPVHDL